MPWSALSGHARIPPPDRRPLSVTPDDSTRQLVERYDREASAYRDLWAPILRLAALKLLPKLTDGAAQRVLDVGTGIGALLPDISQAFPVAHVVGVDRSSGMLALVPRPFDHAAMDAEQLGVRGASVDRVLMVFMLFHLPNPADGLREAHRVLRAGGKVGTITWGSELESDAIRTWTECLDAFGAEQADPGAVSRHDRVDSTEKVAALLAEAGFGNADCWVDDLVHRFSMEHLIRLRTSMGPSKPRFDSLTPENRAACIAEARRRMESMPSEAFVARAGLVYSVARA